MRAVVLGAGGLLGRALCRTVPADLAMISWQRSDVDIRDTTSLAHRLRDARPDWVLNATAYTNVDGAEREYDLALDVNGRAVGDLARLCRDVRCGLLHVSTDYVFAGDRDACYGEDDPVSPVNAYGVTKERGEHFVRKSGVTHTIVRTQWVFGLGGRSFLSTVAPRARRREPIRVVADEAGQCTYAEDLARACWRMLGSLTGTVHVANRGRTSRYEVARYIYDRLGVGDLVIEARSADVPMAAKRPTSSILCLDRVESHLGRPMPHWWDAVNRYLAVHVE